MANPGGPPLTEHPTEHRVATEFATFPGPTFYVTNSEPLSPKALLLAVVAAVGAVVLIPYIMGRTMATAAGQTDADDPDQVDVIVVGDPGQAKAPGRHGDHVSAVHPTILVHLPRVGPQLGLIPDSPAGHLLYNWLAAFNQASYPAMATALATVALPSTTAAVLELRRKTGGFSLLSAKEVEPGILIFRLLDQTPGAATEFSAPSRCAQTPTPPRSRASA